MGDPGNPTDPSGTSGSEPDPGQPGWASPTPPTPAAPPPPPPAPPTPASFGTPPPPTVPGAPPAASGWEPPAPAVKKRRLTWLWILIPVLLVFVTSVVLIAVFAIRAIVGPIETTDDYFTALRDQNYSKAYDLRCAAFKAQISEPDFAQREQANGSVSDFNINDFQRQNDTTTTEGDVTRSGVSYHVTVRLEKEDGDWKVCEISATR
jgi:hypothetical protein